MAYCQSLTSDFAREQVGEKSSCYVPSVQCTCATSNEEAVPPGGDLARSRLRLFSLSTHLILPVRLRRRALSPTLLSAQVELVPAAAAPLVTLTFSPEEGRFGKEKQGSH